MKQSPIRRATGAHGHLSTYSVSRSRLAGKEARQRVNGARRALDEIRSILEPLRNKPRVAGALDALSTAERAAAELDLVVHRLAEGE